MRLRVRVYFVKGLRTRLASCRSRTKMDSRSLPGARYLLKVAEGKKDMGPVISYAVGRLQERGLRCVVEDRYIVMSADPGTLLKQAEKMRWMKLLKNSDEVAPFTVAREGEFQPSDGEKLFTSAECSLLLYHCLENTPYTPSGVQKVHECVLEASKGFLSALRLCKPPVLEEVHPLHEQEDCKSLMTMLRWSLLPTVRLDVQHIRNYFGEEVGFYFGWMCFYLKFICAPLVVGLAMYTLRPRGVTVDTDPYLPFFSVIMALWGVLFIVFWQRQSNTYSFLWNTYTLSPADELRPEYHGYPSIDPVTHQRNVYYPDWKRRLWYLFSAVAMLPLLSLGVAAMTLSLNLNGYVKSTHSPIYVKSLARYAQPGGLFAGDSPYFLWLVPTLGHSVCVSIINSLYSRVAEWCTHLENHRTVQRWHNSLVVKRVFFECFDCFMPLFYIAFYQLDVVTLRAEIVSLFMSDEIRRVVVETAIPLARRFLVGWVTRKLGRAGNVPDTILAEYDMFDDYLEMVVQFGYITLFASAFPLGAAVTFLFLYVEVRSDLFKLITAYRRPLPRRVRDVGVWSEVMQGMVLLAVLTNCLILGFSSEQLLQWLPWLYSRDPTSGGDQILAIGSGRYVVGVVFGCEHLLLLVSLWLRYAIHPTPKRVRLAIARRNYLLSRQSACQREPERESETVGDKEKAD